jgi:aldose 1-epimerase
MATTSRQCGIVEGQELVEFTLRNARGMTVKVINYGAIVSSVLAPDRAGRFDEVTLGFDEPADYVNGNPPYMGAICGRYANRIAQGQFKLDSRRHKLAINNGPNALHGGLRGFDKRMWSVVSQGAGGKSEVTLRYVSPDGEEGYPGTLDATVRYALGDDNELALDYAATTDKATVLNLTNHMYFNLASPEARDIRGHELQVRASHYLETDENLIPTGRVRNVRGTPLDFVSLQKIGARLDSLGTGYDHNLCLDNAGSSAWVARVRETGSGRVMEMRTTEPGVQFYTGYYLDGVKGRGGVVYGHYAGFALEAQHYPDSPNRPEFPSVVLRPGQTYRQATSYRFSAE